MWTKKHPQHVNKEIEFFKRQANQLNSQVSLLDKQVTVLTKALRASLEASYLIPKNMKPHTIGESLMCETMHGKEVAGSLISIPLLRATVGRCADSISADIKMQQIRPAIRRKH